MEAGGATQRGDQTPERETEQRRTQESRVIMEILFSLLERMLNKYIISHSLISKREQWKKCVHYNFSISFFKMTHCR